MLIGSLTVMGTFVIISGVPAASESPCLAYRVLTNSWLHTRQHSPGKTPRLRRRKFEANREHSTASPFNILQVPNSFDCDHTPNMCIAW